MLNTAREPLIMPKMDYIYTPLEVVTYVFPQYTLIRSFHHNSCANWYYERRKNNNGCQSKLLIVVVLCTMRFRQEDVHKLETWQLNDHSEKKNLEPHYFL